MALEAKAIALSSEKKLELGAMRIVAGRTTASHCGMHNRPFDLILNIGVAYNTQLDPGPQRLGLIVRFMGAMTHYTSPGPGRPMHVIKLCLIRMAHQAYLDRRFYEQFRLRRG